MDMSINMEQVFAAMENAGLSRADTYVLSAIQDNPDEASLIAFRASADSDRDLPGPVSVAECSEAIQSLLCRHIIQVITDDTLQSIRGIIQSDNAIGPFGPLPDIGSMDFTVHAADIYVQYIKEAFGHDYFQHIGDVDGWTSDQSHDVYATTKQDLTEFIETAYGLKYDQSSYSIHSINAWRPYWWLRLDNGVTACIPLGDARE